MKRLFRLFRRRRRGSGAAGDEPDPKDVARHHADDAGSWGYFDARSAGREYGLTDKYNRSL